MIEIEFIPVGDETNTGDAILCHFTEPGTATERVVVVDGGFVGTSDAIVSHIQKYYGTSRVDLMVCTHPDADHINGLSGVIDALDVSTLVVHRPSGYGHTGDDVAAGSVEDLIASAAANGTKVMTSAFAGTTFFNGAIVILGPTEEFYRDQLRAQVSRASVFAAAKSRVGSLFETIRIALRGRTTDPGEGEFTDNGGTTPRNNSSIIFDVQVDGYRALLTGDAGVPALTQAVDTASSLGRGASYPNFFDVPHHGSRHNLDANTLTRLIGPIDGAQLGTAFVSVGAKADDFPRAEVANALKRRGFNVCATRGKTIWWSENAPRRDDWGPITPLGWLEVD